MGRLEPRCDRSERRTLPELACSSGLTTHHLGASRALYPPLPLLPLGDGPTRSCHLIPRDRRREESPPARRTQAAERVGGNTISAR
eukprot:scaffold330500_cov59-Tisochrysis_lutea.AAC.4